MAVLNSALSLVDMYGRGLIKNNILKAILVELLDKDLGFSANAPIIEGTGTLQHSYKQRVGLPTAKGSKSGGYTTASKSDVATVVTDIVQIKTWATIPMDDYEIGGEASKQYLKEESAAHYMTIDQELERMTIYGDRASTTQDEFDGLTKFWVSPTSGAYKQNVISATAIAGQTDCTSIWLAGFGGTGIQYAYPAGSNMAGMIMRTLPTGRVDVNASGDNRFVKDYEYGVVRGLAVPDWRNVVRISNIDTSVLNADTTGATINLFNLTQKSVVKVPTRNNAVKYKWIMNRQTFGNLLVQLGNKTNNYLTYKDIGNDRSKVYLHGYEIIFSDSILNTETYVA